MGMRVLSVRLAPFLPPPFGRGRWLSLRWRAPWLRWALGGYAASVVGYNAIDALGAALLPPPPPGVTPVDTDVLVSQLLSPEGGDRVALALGSLAPCVSAPVFEEVLYRGFLLPALTRFVPFRAALPLSAVLFALHHNAAPALLPLTALGLLWATLYVRSANLLVVMLVHAMWNTRIFLASLLGA